MAAFSFACFSSGNVTHPPIPFAPPELQSSTPRPAPGHIPAPCPWHRAGRGGAGRGRAPGRAAGGSTGLGGAVPAETVPGWAGPAPLFPPALRPDKMAEGRRLAACSGRCCRAQLGARPAWQGAGGQAVTPFLPLCY